MFAYRWLLLDCKREFPFKNIFRIFEALWASLPIDRFELDNHLYSHIDDLDPSSIINTSVFLSSSSRSSIDDEIQSRHSSIDDCDSDCRDESNSSVSDLSINYSQQKSLPVPSSILLEKWLKHFSSIDNNDEYSDMFTIFLCIALLEQNRSLIMHMSTSNVDNDDCIQFYFKRLIRKNDAQQTLKLAKNYHRQYILFQAHVKQLLRVDK